jgi:hypothetical protein
VLAFLSYPQQSAEGVLAEPRAVVTLPRLVVLKLRSHAALLERSTIIIIAGRQMLSPASPAQSPSQNKAALTTALSPPAYLFW